LAAALLSRRVAGRLRLFERSRPNGSGPLYFDYANRCPSWLAKTSAWSLRCGDHRHFRRSRAPVCTENRIRVDDV